MGQFDSFYKAKDYIVDILKKELVGPTKEDEVLDTPPLNTYVSGILQQLLKSPHILYKT